MEGGKDVLDMLFVELINPPTPVRIKNLLENIVPLTRTCISTSCQLPDDTRIAVSCNQIKALPNFVMTDYASQGKTRLYNIVELSYSCSHQGYYTALLSSMTTVGTLILNSLHASKITGGASGALHQEFCELELLNDMMTLRFYGRLPRKVGMADWRNTLIASFREHKGPSYAPSTVHKAIRWNKADPFLEWEECVVGWRLVEKNLDGKESKVKKIGALSPPGIASSSEGAHCSTPLLFQTVKKRKSSHISQDSDTMPNTPKKAKSKHGPLEPLEHLQTSTPTGSQWQGNSCAYDAVFATLFNIWQEDKLQLNGVGENWALTF